MEKLAREIRTSPPKWNRLFTNIKVKAKFILHISTLNVELLLKRLKCISKTIKLVMIIKVLDYT